MEGSPFSYSAWIQNFSYSTSVLETVTGRVQSQTLHNSLPLISESVFFLPVNIELSSYLKLKFCEGRDFVTFHPISSVHKTFLSI
jgi:hypothetical protein